MGEHSEAAEVPQITARDGSGTKEDLIARILLMSPELKCRGNGKMAF